jgi:hypothetical protein
MRWRTVRTQAELERALADGDWADLGEDGRFVVNRQDTATVEAYGTATVEAYVNGGDAYVAEYLHEDCERFEVTKAPIPVAVAWDGPDQYYVWVPLAWLDAQVGAVTL